MRERERYLRISPGIVNVLGACHKGEAAYGIDVAPKFLVFFLQKQHICHDHTISQLSYCICKNCPVINCTPMNCDHKNGQEHGY